MSITFCKSLSGIILAFVVFINTFGNFIGVGDIIPTEPAETTTTTVTETTLPVEDETTVVDGMTKAEFVAFLNAETAKAANGSYSYNRNCYYTNPIDVGGATDILNSIIKGIDENSSLDTVVGDFLGIGSYTGEMPEDYIDSNYQLKATTLNEDDIESFAVNGGVYTFTLADATNPKKTGETSFSRFTNDFVTHEEVVDGISGFTTAIKVNSTTANYKNIKVQVTVADGKITNIKYSYTFDAALSIKALVVNVNGTGAAATNAEFSNIEY